MPLEDAPRADDQTKDQEPAQAAPVLSKDDTKKRRRLILALAALYLALEKDTRRALIGPVRLATLAALTLRSVSQNSDAPSVLLSPAAYQTLSVRADELQNALQKAVLEERKRARRAIFLLMQRFGHVDDQASRQLQELENMASVEAHDRIASQVLAQSVRDTWLRLHVVALLQSSKASFEQARKALRPKIDMLATTDVGQVINHHMALVAVQSSSLSTAYEWQAILDEATCGACEERDGKLVSPSDFPPLHPRCRCFVVPRSRTSLSTNP